MRRGTANVQVRTATGFSAPTGPYRDHLRKRRAGQPAVPILQLLREIRELGYPGSRTLLV